MKKILLFIFAISMLASCVTIQPATPCHRPKKVLFVSKQYRWNNPHHRHH